jgi:serine/threonine-protein kinase RsbW
LADLPLGDPAREGDRLFVPLDPAGPPNVRLSVSNRPENVVLVRQMLAGLAEAVGLDPNELNDISTAVTEACNNVVLHAYDEEEGPLEVDVYSSPGAIEVVVRDHGTGILPRTSRADETAGIGLSVIQALTQRVEFRGTANSGTEVQMAFATPDTNPLEPFSDDGGIELPAIVEAELVSAIEIAIAPAPLARTILPRLLSALAARAHFRTDRIADMQLVADALAAQVPGSITGSHLSIGISFEPHDLEVRIAPLHAGRADELMLDSADGVVAVIGKLTDHHRVATVGPTSEAEMLALRLVDRR